NGTVTSIRKAPINVANVITYDAVIGVSNEDLALFPGMTANVKILVSQRKDVLRVPNSALRYHPPSDSVPAGSAGATGRRGAAPEKAVWVLDTNNDAQRLVVSAGESDGTYTEITGGNLKEGDRVIVATAGTAASSSRASGSQAVGGRRGGPGF